MGDRSARSVRRVLAVVVLGGAALIRPFAAPASAEPGDGICDRTWALPVSGSWQEPSNWLEGTVPTADDDVCIVAPGTYTVTAGPSAPAAAATLTLGLPLGTDGPKLTVDGSTLTLAGTGQVHPGSAVVLTSSASAADAALLAGGLLTNDGTLRAIVGAGGGRTLRGAVANAGVLDVAAPLTYDRATDLTNTGSISVATGASFCVCGSAGTTPRLLNTTGTVANGGALTVAAAAMTQGTGDNSGFGVVLRGATLTLAGDGAGGFLADSGTTTVIGNVGPEQTITALAGTANGNVTLSLPGDTGNAGSILLRSTDAARRASLVLGTGATLANTGSLRTVAGASAGHRIIGLVVNTGTIAANADAVFGGTLTNRGVLTVGAQVTFTIGAAARVVNDTLGAVTATGRLVVANGADWEQGAGAVTGDVFLAGGGDLAFTGAGAGRFVADGAGTITGDIATGQSLLLNAGATRGASAGFTNAGALSFVAAGTTATSLSLPTGAQLTNAGTLKVVPLPGTPPPARIDGILRNLGTVEVSPLATLMTTAFTQGSAGTLQIDVSGPTSFGRLTTGDATLAGTLHALVTYDPPAETAFAVLSHTTRTGTFGALDAGTSGFSVRYDPAAVTLLSPNRAPTADAGADRTVNSGTAFTLDGRSSSDPEGGALTYLWETTSAAVIRDPTSAVTSVDGVTGPATLTFRLTVTDGGGNSDTDDVVITVKPK